MLLRKRDSEAEVSHFGGFGGSGLWGFRPQETPEAEGGREALQSIAQCLKNYKKF